MSAHLEGEVKEHKAHNEDLPRSPSLLANEGMLAEPFLCDLLLLIHVLGKLEIEEGNLVAREVTRQFNVHCAAAISDRPLGMVVLLRAEAAHTLDEILSLRGRAEGVAALKIGKVGSL